MDLTDSRWASGVDDQQKDLDVLAAIGPQRASDNPLARRVRFHQSWYRAVVLGSKSFGSTANAQPRALGSILTDDDGRAGLNFTSSAARRLFASRRAEGWGVDPIRCVKYLTSSQALTINIFGLLAECEAWSARVLRDVLQRSDIAAVKWIKIEYAPRRRSEYLHDSTRLDVLIQVSTPTGDQLVVAEVKYSDRFNSRPVNIDRPPYRQLANAHLLWADADTVLRTSAVNQLARCHALAVAVSHDLTPGQKELPKIVVLHHESDANSSAAIASYTACLEEPSLIRSASLRTLVSALRTQARSPQQRRAARDLALRYIDECESEQAWAAYKCLQAERGN